MKNAFNENYRITSKEKDELLSYKRRRKSISISELQKHFRFGYRKARYVYALLEGKE